MSTRAPTIKDVARAAGVGVGTASRALGSGELVSPATRARVHAAAQRAGYRPSRAAKVLRGAPARIVAVLVPDLGLPLYAQFLRGAGEAARRHDYLMLVCDGQNSRGVMDEQLERLDREQIDGLVVAGTTYDQPRLARFVASGIPIAPDLPRPTHAKSGGSARRAPGEGQAALTAFRHLVALGHRRIAFVAHVERDTQSVSGLQRARIACLRRSLDEVGAPLDEGLIAGADGPDACRARLAEILSRRDRPTAVVPGTEALTPAVLASVAAAQLEIPRDVSVFGFGDSLWEQAYRPPLSVVRFDYEGVGRALVENLVARIARARTVPPVPPLATEFVDRGSCAPPPGATRVRRR